MRGWGLGARAGKWVGSGNGSMGSGLEKWVSWREPHWRVLMHHACSTVRSTPLSGFLAHDALPLCPHLPARRREMRARSEVGGFEFMPRPSDSYYASLPKKIGDVLTPQQYK